MMEIIPYTDSLEEGIKLLCKIPVSGTISLALEREPLYFRGSQVQCEKPEVFVAYEALKNKVWAVYNVGKRRLWINGNIEWVRYLSDLRIHPDKHGSSLLYRISRHFEKISEGDLWPAQTIVFSDNHRMLRMIRKRAQMRKSASLPYYHFAGTLITHLCPFNLKNPPKTNAQIRKATLSDVADMQIFADTQNSKINYAPYLDFFQLNSAHHHGLNIDDFFLAIENGRIIGICGIWDQNHFKQTRIVSYHPVLSMIRLFYNLLRKIGSGTPLPKSGSILKYLNLHSIIVENRNPEIFRQLIYSMVSVFKNQKYDYWMCSLSENDPLTEVFNAIHSRNIKGNYYLVNRSADISPQLLPEVFCFESARI